VSAEPTATGPPTSWRPVEVSPWLAARQLKRRRSSPPPERFSPLLSAVIPFRFSLRLSSAQNFVHRQNGPNWTFRRQSPPDVAVTLPRPAGSVVLFRPPPRKITAPGPCRFTHCSQFPAVPATVLYLRYTILYPVHTRFSVATRPIRHSTHNHSLPRHGANTTALTAP
jgi:hypothetical protein